MADRPSEYARVASYGRGGAGNIGRDDPTTHTSPADLVTPTLKADKYTTGRGGTGNMMNNDFARPEVARASQDVDAPRHREQDGPHHFGRGGAANVVAKSQSPEGRASGEGERKKREWEGKRRESMSEGKGLGLVTKGKEFLINKLGGVKK